MKFKVVGSTPMTSGLGGHGRMSVAEKERCLYGPNRSRYPSWLREWIENQGYYVRLECGCIEDLHDYCVLLIGPKKTVCCERHGEWSAVIESVSVREVLGIPKVEMPDEPPF